MNARAQWSSPWRCAIVAAAIAGPTWGAAPATAQVRPGANGGPVVEARVGGVSWTDESMTLRITVLVPPGHHGYVDRGDDGFYIPMTFTFPSLEGAGVESTERARPGGERDETVRAFVFRGRGDFEFEFEPAEALSGIDEIETKLRYQVCNDRTKICYSPKTQSIRVPIR